jgi:hypothetical protein
MGVCDGGGKGLSGHWILLHIRAAQLSPLRPFFFTAVFAWAGPVAGRAGLVAE